MSDKSGFSTASKQAIADMRAENARKDGVRDAEMAKKDAEMETMKVQMAEMLKTMKNTQKSSNKYLFHHVHKGLP